MIDHLWQSTVFGVLAVVLTLALRKQHARARYWIWVAASCKFLIPFSLLVGIGGHFGWSRAPAAVQPVASFVAEEFGATLAIPKATVAPAPSRPTAFPILPAAWLCGSATVLFSWMVRLRRVTAVVRDARLLGKGREFEAVRRLHGGGIELRCSTERIEPGVFGIWSPVLLLPEGIAERFSDSQLDAILAHEICHVRRRDNLTAAIHMGVEAMFWFHPLVWWLGSRLVEERERACDEEVLRLGNEPQVYAQSILKTCQFQMEPPAACVSGVTGADLRMRIEEIMAHRPESRLGLGRRLVLTTAGIAAVAGPIIVGVAHAPEIRAQSTAAFEAASIKPSQPGLRGSGMPPVKNGNFRAVNVPLKDLIEEAFHIQSFQVSGGPGWINSDRFDVTAKADGKVPTTQIRQMLQTLLADRFKLVVKHESKDLPVYALVVVKGGVKMKRSDGGDCPETPVPDHPCGGFRVRQRRQITGEKIPMGSLVDILSTLLGRTVVDRTGLKGYFDVNLEWTPEEGQFGSFGREPEGTTTESNGPSVFTAVQEQLGLKLESTKGPVEILVVTHAERPSAN